MPELWNVGQCNTTLHNTTAQHHTTQHNTTTQCNATSLPHAYHLPHYTALNNKPRWQSFFLLWQVTPLRIQVCCEKRTREWGGRKECRESMCKSTFFIITMMWRHIRIRPKRSKRPFWLVESGCRHWQWLCDTFSKACETTADCYCCHVLTGIILFFLLFFFLFFFSSLCALVKEKSTPKFSQSTCW